MVMIVMVMKRLMMVVGGDGNDDYAHVAVDLAMMIHLFMMVISDET